MQLTDPSSASSTTQPRRLFVIHPNQRNVQISCEPQADVASGEFDLGPIYIGKPSIVCVKLFGRLTDHTSAFLEGYDAGIPADKTKATSVEEELVSALSQADTTLLMAVRASGKACGLGVSGDNIRKEADLIIKDIQSKDWKQAFISQLSHSPGQSLNNQVQKTFTQEFKELLMTQTVPPVVIKGEEQGRTGEYGYYPSLQPQSEDK